jgi:hypothetical protein
VATFLSFARYIIKPATIFTLILQNISNISSDIISQFLQIMFIVHTNSNFQSPLPQDNNCADSNLVIWGGGGRIILTHCTPDSDFKDISNGNHALHGELPTVFVVPAYVSIQCKSCLHPGKTPVQIAKSADYRLLQPQAVRFLASHLRRNSCATPLSLYWRSFKGLIAL